MNTQSYTGPFPRKRHSHRCMTCERRHGHYNRVACYRAQCTRASVIDNCQFCKPVSVNLNKSSLL